MGGKRREKISSHQSKERKLDTEVIWSSLKSGGNTMIILEYPSEKVQEI